MRFQDVSGKSRLMENHDVIRRVFHTDYYWKMGGNWDWDFGNDGLGLDERR